MMKHTRLLRLAVMIASCAAVGTAANLPLESLPANAKWVLHLDVKALRDSPLGRELLTALAGSPQEADLQVFEAAFACDVRRDLVAITVCGAGGEAQGGVAYLRGNWDLQKLSAMLAGNQPSATASYGRHTILNWSGVKADGSERQSVCLVSSNLVLLASREAALRQALNALDGQAPTLATLPRFRRLAAADTNAFLRIVAVDLKEIVADQLLAVALSSGDSLRLAVSSDGAEVHAKAVLQEGTPAAALETQQALVGLQAVMMLQGLKNPDIGKIAKSARIEVNGLEVSVVLSASVETVRHLVFARPGKKSSPQPVPASF